MEGKTRPCHFLARPGSFQFTTLGTLQEANDQYPRAWARLALEQPGVHLLIRGYRILGGLALLKRTRRLYGQLLDVPRVLMSPETHTSPVASAFETTLVSVFSISHVAYLRRRQPRAASGVGRVTNTPGGHDVQLSPVFTTAMFIYGHVLVYYAGGAARPFGGKLLMVFAVVQLGGTLEA